MLETESQWYFLPPAPVPKMPTSTKERVRFGPYEVDFTAGELRKSGSRLRIQGKPLAVLEILVETPCEIVSRETLRTRLWADNHVFVDFDKGLSTAVNKLREALCDSAEKPKYIETVPKRGYRFLAAVERVVEKLPTSPNIDLPSKPVSHAGMYALIGRKELLLLLSFCMIGVVSAWFLWKTSRPAKQTTGPTIAVIPFSNRSPDPKEVYFSDGLSEEVVTDLGRIPGLRVIGRSSSFQFRTGSADPRDIGQRLGVLYLVEGSVVKIGDRVRIEAELVNSKDGFQMWSESYETKIDDVLRVEDDISRSVASALSIKLLGPDHSQQLNDSPTVNAEAYQAYLQARYFKGRWITSELKTSLSFLNRSLQIDPNYGPAWALRSSTFSSMGDMGILDKVEAMQRARKDAQRAIELNGDLPEGYLALATVQMNEWDSRSAEISLGKALQLAPRDTSVLVIQSQLQRMSGHLDDCIATLRRVTVLDPLSPGAFGMLGNRLYSSGRYQEALLAQERTLELNPETEFIHLNRAEVYLALHQPQEALKEVNREPGELWSLLGKTLVYHDLGRQQESEAALQELIAKHAHDEAYVVAEVYAYRNDAENSFRWLDRAFSQHDSSLIDIKNDPLLSNLHSDSRYSELTRRIGASD